MAGDSPEAHHWRKSLRITALLLAVWFVVTFGATFFARELGIAHLGWPFSFWMAAQGAPIVYVILVWLHARRMARLDLEFDLAEDD